MSGMPSLVPAGCSGMDGSFGECWVELDSVSLKKERERESFEIRISRLLEI